MPFNINYKNERARYKETWVEKINELMEGEISKKVYVLFATQDTTNKPDGIKNYQSLFSKEGFAMNTNEDNDLLSRPDESKLPEDESFDYFVWISKGVCEGEDIHFARVYAHELNHIKQDVMNPYLLFLGNLVSNVLRYEMDNPVELDCEIAAIRILHQIFREDDIRSYMEKRKSSSISECIRYNVLSEIDINKREQGTPIRNNSKNSIDFLFIFVI